MSLIPRLTAIGNRAAWFFHFQVMSLTFGISCIVLTYLVAAMRLPLVDGALHDADLTIGFHWHAFSHWLENHPIPATILRWAYNSLAVQPLVVLFLLVGEDEIKQATDFFLAMMVSAIVVVIISVALPALGYPGGIGRAHIIALIHARHHALQTISAGKITGIVTFPSFHAAMGVIIAYTMRTRLWRRVIFIPLNVLLIVATAPVGGHYLVDTIAGCMVGGAVLYAVAKWSPDSTATADGTRLVRQPARDRGHLR